MTSTDERKRCQTVNHERHSPTIQRHSQHSTSPICRPCDSWTMLVQLLHMKVPYLSRSTGIHCFVEQVGNQHRTIRGPTNLPLPPAPSHPALGTPPIPGS